MVLSANSKISWRSTAVVDSGLEQVIGADNFQHPWFLRKGAALSRAVCKIGNLGTAFLIGPTLLMTNWHVLRRSDWAAGRKAIFDYEQAEEGGFGVTTSVDLRPDLLFHSSEELDVAIVAVNPVSGDRGFVDISRPATPLPDTRLNIIQHPGGGLKVIAIRDNGIKYIDDVIVQYWTDTEHGSSGSPVFDDNWEIVALHYRHDSASNADGSTVFYNEGHTMSSIKSYLDGVLPASVLPW